MQKLLLETTNPVMLTNIVYEAGETYQDPDWLAIVYKDMVTGKKHVLNIDNPTIEVGILKEEYSLREGGVLIILKNVKIVR